MKFGLFFGFLTYPITFDEVRKLALRAEQLGYDSLWICDHLMNGEEPMLECLTTLTALALTTKKIRLGSLVLSISYRNPAFLAKIAATLDIISDGRLELGIGAGHLREEYESYGFPFPKPGVRVRQLREGIEIIKKLWTETKATYKGKYYAIKDAYCEPKPLQKPYPPITIGGGGEKLTLRVVAEHADRSNLTGNVKNLKRKLEILKNHCTAVGRDYEKIEKSCTFRVIMSKTEKGVEENMKKFFSRNIHPYSRSRLSETPISYKEWKERTMLNSVIGTPSECVEKIRECANLGITYFMPNFTDIPSDKSMELFAKKVIPRL
jgi:F420-dependent oxidoreductase-like protein